MIIGKPESVLKYNFIQLKKRKEGKTWILKNG